MTEEDVVRLFQAASRVGFEYGIPLLGDDSVVALAGAGTNELDHRVSDSEHVIHELAHCVLWLVDFGEPKLGLLARHAAIEEKQSEYDKQLAEIETFSVTMEVLRRFNIEVVENDFLVQLMVQLEDFGEDWVKTRMNTFHTTNRGKQAVEQIVGILNKEIE